jgi:hypothetical protein
MYNASMAFECSIIMNSEVSEMGGVNQKGGALAKKFAHHLPTIWSPLVFAIKKLASYQAAFEATSIR